MINSPPMARVGSPARRSAASAVRDSPRAPLIASLTTACDRGLVEVDARLLVVRDGGVEEIVDVVNLIGGRGISKAFVRSSAPSA